MIRYLSDKVKRLMIFNAKGGTGKTALALNFALTFGYGIVTNDPSTIIESVLPSSRCLTLSKNQNELPDIPPNEPIIYDFGGYPDARAEEVLRMSEYVIVPILPSSVDLITNLNFLEELKLYKPQNKIILVINQLEGGGLDKLAPAYKKLSPFFREHNSEIAIFPLRKTAVFSWMVEQKKPLAGIASQAREEKRIYASFFNQASREFDCIVDYLFDSHEAFFTNPGENN